MAEQGLGGRVMGQIFLEWQKIESCGEQWSPMFWRDIKHKRGMLSYSICVFVYECSWMRKEKGNFLYALLEKGIVYEQSLIWYTKIWVSLLDINWVWKYCIYSMTNKNPSGFLSNTLNSEWKLKRYCHFIFFLSSIPNQ